MRRAFPALMLAWCCTLSAARELAPSTSKATVSSMSGCIGRPCDPVDEVRSRPPCVGVEASSWSICVRMRSASVHGVCMCVNAWSGRGRVQGLRVRYLVANARLRARPSSPIVRRTFAAGRQRVRAMRGDGVDFALRDVCRCVCVRERACVQCAVCGHAGVCVCEQVHTRACIRPCVRCPRMCLFACVNTCGCGCASAWRQRGFRVMLLFFAQRRAPTMNAFARIARVCLTSCVHAYRCVSVLNLYQ
jgi:hypothetical protein